MQNEEPRGEIVFYQTEDGRSRVECRFVEESLWLSQATMAELYQKDVRTINEHLMHIIEEGEIDPAATIRKFRIVRREGKREVARLIEHYNLDAILAVGYRVRSARGTQFRKWATERLREYLVKGFAMDDERLKKPPVEGSRGMTLHTPGSCVARLRLAALRPSAAERCNVASKCSADFPRKKPKFPRKLRFFGV